MASHLITGSNVFTHNNKTLALLNYNTHIKPCNIRIPYEQRLQDDIKVTDIVSYQENYHAKHGNFNFLGVVNFHYCMEDNNHYIVDGQHRFAAVKKLTDRNYDMDLVCEIITVPTLADIKENYNLLNKNTPLPDLSDNIDLNTHKVIFRHFEDKYPDIWRFTTRTKRPYIIKSDFQSAIGFMMEHLVLCDYNEIIAMIETYNRILAKWTPELFMSARDINTKTLANLDKTLEICKTTGMYLGLFNHLNEDFHYYWVRDIIHTQLGYEIKTRSKSKPKKARIPKKIKMEIWNEYIGADSGQHPCWCCKTTMITQLHFVAGHYISEAQGGKVTVENLRPICAGCNSSMGATNMGEYMERHYCGT